MSRTVLILGSSGKPGRHAAAAFRAAGWSVKSYDRRRDDPAAAARGCQVIVNGMNPPRYHDWDRLVPRITEQAIAAARASGATVIVPGNVYNFGAAGGEWSESTKHRPCARKGRIRVEMEETYRAAGVRTVILRAGNFIDPDREGDIMSLLLAKAHRGRIMRLGKSEIPQAWAYLPDWARAVAMLAEKRDELEVFEDVPFPGHTFSYDELRAVLEQALERPLKMSLFPWWLMTLASPFWELAREMREMRYLSDTPHSLSGDKLCRLIPEFSPTDQRAVMLAALPPAA